MPTQFKLSDVKPVQEAEESAPVVVGIMKCASDVPLFPHARPCELSCAGEHAPLSWPFFVRGGTSPIAYHLALQVMTRRPCPPLAGATTAAGASTPRRPPLGRCAPYASPAPCASPSRPGRGRLTAAQRLLRPQTPVRSHEEREAEYERAKQRIFQSGSARSLADGGASQRASSNDLTAAGAGADEDAQGGGDQPRAAADGEYDQQAGGSDGGDGGASSEQAPASGFPPRPNSGPRELPRPRGAQQGGGPGQRKVGRSSIRLLVPSLSAGRSSALLRRPLRRA